MATVTSEVQTDATTASVAKVDMKFEIVVIPVSDADRAKEFYSRLGWRLVPPSGIPPHHRHILGLIRLPMQVD